MTSKTLETVGHGTAFAGYLSEIHSQQVYTAKTVVVWYGIVEFNVRLDTV